MKCPKCFNEMTPIGEGTGGFSAGKAVVGGVLLGPIGLLGGALGKKRVTYQCVVVEDSTYPHLFPKKGCGYTVVK